MGTDSLWIETAMVIILVATLLSFPEMYFIGIIMNDNALPREGFAISRVIFDGVGALLGIGFLILWGVNGAWPFQDVPTWEPFAEYINLLVGISEELVIYITVSGIIGVVLDVFLFQFY